MTIEALVHLQNVEDSTRFALDRWRNTEDKMERLRAQRLYDLLNEAEGLLRGML